MNGVTLLGLTAECRNHRGHVSVEKPICMCLEYFFGFRVDRDRERFDRSLLSLHC